MGSTTRPPHWFGICVASAALCGCASVGRPDAAAQVRATEIAFAQSMADRDFAAFMQHVSAEAVFFGDASVQHGRTEVAAAWQRFFGDARPPFAWAPDRVEVLPSGTLALSTGPVTIDGRVVGRFNSVWRLEAPGTWRIVFDKGESVCAQAP